MQVPSFKHGWERHSSMFVSHLGPVKPSAHEHLKLLTPSMQVPLFKQVSMKQSLISEEKRRIENKKYLI